MAIAVSNSSAYDAGGYSNTHTLTGFSCNGTDSFLVVGVAQRQFSTEVSGVTANAVSMTERSESASVNAGVCGVGVMEHVINNASFNIVVSTPAFFILYRLTAIMALALEGVDTDTPSVGTPVTAGGYGTSASAAYTGTADNLLLVFINCQSARTLTALNCTQALNADHPDGNLGQYFAGSVIATGSSQTIGATWTGGDNWRLSIVEVAAAGAPPVVSRAGIIALL